MRVELGNPAPTATGNRPVVTTADISDTYTYVAAYDDGQTQTIGRGREVDVTTASELANEAAAHIGRSINGQSHIPGQEALLAVVAGFRAESTTDPTWVWSDDDDFAVLLGAFFGCPVGRPDNVEATHHTVAGPPGVGPAEEVSQ